MRDEDEDDDGVETFVAGEMAIPNRTIPNNAMLGHPDLVSVTPALDPNLHLYCFKLLQGNVNQGWLLREERDLGLEGIAGWIPGSFGRATTS